jgi:mono/diheme cytochrome c family protein
MAGFVCLPAAAQTPAAQSPAAQTPAAQQALLQKYCSGCHNNKLKTAGVSVEGLDLSNVAGKAEILEK